MPSQKAASVRNHKQTNYSSCEAKSNPNFLNMVGPFAKE